jgi:hypothetical protein
LVLTGVHNPTEFQMLGLKVVKDGFTESCDTTLFVEQPFERIPQYLRAFNL